MLHISHAPGHGSAPLRRSAEQQRDRDDSWEVEWGTCFLSTSTYNTEVYLHLSLCSVLPPAPVFPVPTLITKHTSAPSGRFWPASPRAAESRLAVQQEQAPSPAPQGAPQFALRSPRNKEG